MKLNSSKSANNEKNSIFKGIAVKIKYRSIKNIYIRIEEKTGVIIMHVPLKTTDGRIDEVLKQRSRWINIHRQRVSCAPDVSPESFTAEDRKRLIDNIGKYAGKWEKILGTPCNRWTVRLMKSRWGSCTPGNRTIRINLRLAHFPEECVELVVVHELIHFSEKGHGKEFKRRMTECLPDWRNRTRILNNM